MLAMWGFVDAFSLSSTDEFTDSDIKIWRKFGSIKKQLLRLNLLILMST